MTSLPAILCDCRVSVVNTQGELFTVKSRRWDCPSCGRDKAARIRSMVMAEGVDRMWVLTFDQPPVSRDFTPERHEHCDARSHLRYYAPTNDWRWCMVESCEHCCRHSSRVVALFRKALRRRYPELQMLWVREVKPLSGAFDLNMVVTDVPPVTRKHKAGKEIKALWAAAGGGFMDLGKPANNHHAEKVGRYIGKYLTKLAHRRMAPGFRRWARSQGFAPRVRMNLVPEPCWASWLEKLPGSAVTFLGWVDPVDETVIRSGVRGGAPPF